MDMVSEEAIDEIQKRMVGRIKNEFGLDAGVLLYDTTNFFTFLATTNDRCDVAQRGHSKAKRNDLRQVGLALLVSREFQVPLFHRMYPGNVPDISLFPGVAKELITRHDDVLGSGSEATLVFDKGNVGDDAMERLVVSDQHFVSALAANRLSDIRGVGLEQFERLPRLPGTRAYTDKIIFWGKQCRVVVVYTESFFTQQLAGVTNNLVKCQKKLMGLEKSLRKWREGKSRGKKPTERGVKKSVSGILSAQFMKELFVTTVDSENELPKLSYAVDHDALDKLCNERLGRTTLITDHLDWSPENIIDAYRSLAAIEASFKDMKNIDFLHWQPSYHWTDQKLRVHAFYCVLALLLTSLARKVAVQNGIDLTIPALLKELTAIFEVAVIYPQGTLAHRKDHITLSRMTSRQKKLAKYLDIGQALGR